MDTRIVAALTVCAMLEGCQDKTPTSKSTEATLAVTTDWIVTGSGTTLDDIAAAPDGNVVVAGVAHVKATFAGSAVVSHVVDQPFVAMLSRAGHLVWLQSTDGNAPTVHMALAPDHSIWVVGREASGDSFIDRFGTHGEATGKITLPRVALEAVAILDGDVVVAGQTSGDYELGGESRRCGKTGVLVARLHADGRSVWSACLATPPDFVPRGNDATYVNALIASPIDVALCGRFSAELSLGSATATALPGGPDLFVADLDSISTLLPDHRGARRSSEFSDDDQYRFLVRAQAVER